MSNRKTRTPVSISDWGWDWSDWLAVGETITSATVTVPTGLTEHQEATNDATTVTVWIAGGTLGVEYQVPCVIVTSQGRTEQRSLYLLTTEK